MAFPDQHKQPSALSLDGLFCEETSFEFDELDDFPEKKESPSSFPVLLEEDLFWEDEELLRLISKEKQTRPNLLPCSRDASLISARGEAVEWILKVKEHYGFTALTAVLAVNYFDRFVSSLKFQRDKAWMVQLTAVACLSLAAKVDETQVPLLLDLQVEEAKYVFEAKTINKMELLVLSTLQWRMNPVTPISFFDHIVRRLGLKSCLHWEFLKGCETLLLSLIADPRFMNHLPSTLAAATMLHVIKEVDPCNSMEYQDQLMSVLKIHEDQVNECYNLISELSCCQDQYYKRKRVLQPAVSGNSSFCFDSSNDLCRVASTVSSSPVSCFKRRRTQELQHLQMPLMNSNMFLDCVSNSPY